MTTRTGPTWLCEFNGHAAQYAGGGSPAGAAAECEAAGLGTPTAVTYAGYVAAPVPQEAPHAPPMPHAPIKPDKRSARRAEIVLTLYGLLRCDFPIGSILKPAEAAARLPSASALRDFLANVGAAIEKLTADPRIIDRVIEAQSKAWISAANETNARHLGKWQAAEVCAERKIRYRTHAKRLRKRVGYQGAIAELAASIDGALPRDELAAENFRTILVESGIGVDDVESLVRRYRRITAPKI